MTSPPPRSVSSWHVRPRSAIALRLAVLIAVLAPTVATAAIATPKSALAAPATTTTDLNLREGPGPSYAVLLVMPAGATVEVTGTAEVGFAPVVYAGTSGWASTDFLSTGGAPAPSAPSGATGTSVTTTDLNLRAGPSGGDAVVTIMPAGATVTLTGESANGYHGVVYNGTSGWAYADFLSGGSAPPPAAPAPEPAPAPSPGTSGTATTTTELNLRAGPSTSDAVLLVMPAGATVSLGGNTSNGFSSVTYAGTTGWAYSTYLSTGGTPAPSPDPAPAPPAQRAGDPPPSGGAGTMTTTTALNLRAAPSTDAAILTVMPAGSSVSLTGQSQNGFEEVVFLGQTGWASGSYLSSGGGAPAPAPDPGMAPPPSSDAGHSEQEIIQIIYDAADRYGQPREDMLRVARCESNLNPNAVNPSGSYGLFQFIRSTWATTPYASYDIFDPWANANAAGWMWSVGRRSEWVCQ